MTQDEDNCQFRSKLANQFSRNKSQKACIPDQ
jgi:hypothetical protein